MTLPITLVTGFLGAGKTTCLQHLAQAHRGRSLLFVVNEFGSIDVDGERLTRTLDRVVAIPGGSIFCTCLVSTFLEKMQLVADRADELGLEAVVVEASGMADPRVADRMLRETGLNDRFHLAHVVALVDPGSFGKLLETLPNIRTQIEAADLIVINKTDCYDAAQVDATERLVREINTDAAIQKTTYGSVELDLMTPDHAARVTGEYAQCADPNYTTTVLRFDRPVPIASVRGVIRAVGDDLFRAKGTVLTDRGPMDIDASPSGIACEPTEMAAGQGSELVLIAHGRARGRIVAATAPLAGVGVAG